MAYSELPSQEYRVRLWSLGNIILLITSLFLQGAGLYVLSTSAARTSGDLWMGVAAILVGGLMQFVVWCSAQTRVLLTDDHFIYKGPWGKTVTVVTGLDHVASNLDAISAQLKSACAAGGTINEGKIEIQGDHRKQALSILQDLGYPAKLSGG